MKTALIAVLLVCLISRSLAQTPWLDAGELNKYLSFNPARNRVELDNSVSLDTLAFLSTLKKYCPGAVTQTGEFVTLNLEACFQGNPFINLRAYAQQNPVTRYALRRGGPQPRPESLPALSPAAMGGSLLTSLADGLAMFLVQRTKEELNAAFFDGLRKNMEKQPAFKAIFPVTHGLVMVIDRDIYNYNAYLQALRESFIRDMRALPENFRDYAADGDFIKKEEFRILVQDVLTLTQSTLDGQPWVEAMDYLSKGAALQDAARWDKIEDEKRRAGVQNLAMSLRTLQLFSNSLRVRESGSTWATVQEVADSMRDVSFSYLYLGLLYQQSVGITYAGNVSLQAVLKKIHDAADVPLALRQYLQSLVQTGAQLDQSIGKMREKIGTGQVNYDDYYRFSHLVFSFLEHISDFREKILFQKSPAEGGPIVGVDSLGGPVEQAEIQKIEEKFLTVLRQVFELEGNVRQKHYTSAVNNVLGLLLELLEKDFTFRREFLRYANFMATLAEAQTSEDVAAVIDAFALPPGSSRLKKQSPISVSLNSYGGLAAGREKDFGGSSGQGLQDDNVLAVYAPLGLDLNFGLRNNAGSLSFYTQLIDVGAIFAYRFSDQTERIPEIKFENIFAPGFYGVYGFGNNIPVSFGLGAQFGPNLRKIDPAAGLDISETNAWRLGAFLSVDIPIIHFYTR